MGIPTGFISQRTIRVDVVSKYYRLLGDPACSDGAHLSSRFPFERRVSRQGADPVHNSVSAGIVRDTCFISHLQLIRILYRSRVCKGFFIVLKFIHFFFLQETRQKI